jgi:hypothetical protein
VLNNNYPEEGNFASNNWNTIKPDIVKHYHQNISYVGKENEALASSITMVVVCSAIVGVEEK